VLSIEGERQMKADPDDIQSHESQRSRFPLVELLIALALVAGLAFFWFWSDDKNPEETVAELPTAIVPAQAPELPPTPDIPVREEVVTVEVSDTDSAATEESAAPITPEAGKLLLRQQLAAAGADTNLAKLANTEHPVDVSAALIDGMGRGMILRKILPMDPPKQAFSVEQDGDIFYMGATSYARYDDYTDTIAALDTGALVETFHTLRPLYKQAYEQLGLNPEDFDNAIIRALDLVLATPEIAEPIALNAKSVVYVYQDPAMESLPALQKQLLRVGPDNLRRIKQQARVLREGLLAQ
jgi:Protein of unknown function (DUF3014)